MKAQVKTLLIVFLLVFIQFKAIHAVQKVNTCTAWYESASQNYLRKSLIMTPDGKWFISPAENPTLDLPANMPTNVRSLMDFLNSRTPEELLSIKNELTRRFAQEKAGSFAVKDSKGKSKPFYVTVNPIPLPIPRSYETQLVESTRALFESQNDLLQVFYSKENVSVEDLRAIAVKGTPDAVLEDVISYVKSNHYFEKGIISPTMDKYRFISVVGVDHALTTIREMKALGFEFNGGTPSGWSNTRAILEVYKKVLPQFAHVFEQALEADNAFQNFKRTMDAHGVHWTGNKKGISVVVSPGHFNASHPDVVSIAEYSGLPLVKMSDLYVDRSGTLRLNQPGVNPNNHPTVTSIYSRHEESAIYSATSPSKGLSFKTPRILTNVEKKNLAKLGLDVEEGVGYEFIENSKGVIINVNRDESGRPKKLVMANAMLGRDPTLTEHEPTSPLDILDLNNNGKVYLSNRGGRTLDIKPLFAIIAKYFAPKHTDGPIFSPPTTLDLNDPRISDSEHEKFYTNAKGYVVKVANESSGNGIDIVSQKNNDGVQEVIEKVQADQARVKQARKSGSRDAVASYTIQEFVDSAVITTAIVKDGKAVKVTVVPDLRKFNNFMPTGEVLSGNLGYLGRSGPHGSAISNTGKGGDYFIPLVYDDGSAPVQIKKTKQVSTRKKISSRNNATVSDVESLNRFFGSLGELRHIHRLFDSSDGRYKLFSNNRNVFERLSYEYRDVMHLLGPEFRPLQALFDQRRMKQITDVQFRKQLSAIIQNMIQKPNHEWTYREVGALVKYWLVDWTAYQYQSEPGEQQSQ